MPRSRGGSGGRSRPAAAPARPAATPPQQSSRGASTAAHPPANAQQAGASAQQGKSSGLLGQMASTAAGVAVGSSIGHAVGGMFGWSGAPAEQQQSDNAVASQANESSSQSNAWGPRSCETDAKTFTKCLDENQGNMQICGWYLDQLKACQQAYNVSGLPYSPQKDNTDLEKYNSESVLVKADLAISAYDGENNKNVPLYYRSS